MIDPLPIRNCQNTEWTLHFSMWPMRAHSKQSTNKKIKGNTSAYIYIQVQEAETNIKFEMQYPDRLLLTSSGEEWQFHMSTDI